MKRANFVFCSIVLFCFLFLSCSTSKKTNTTLNECKWVSGTVIDMTSLDGCRYLIQLKDSSFLEPTNLTDEYRLDKKRVCLQYKLKPAMSSICMKGKIIEIINIE